LRLEFFVKLLLNANDLLANCVDKNFLLNLVRGRYVGKFRKFRIRKQYFFVSFHPNFGPHTKGGDQMANLAEVVNKHLGVMVRWPELTEVSLASAIASVLGDLTFQVDTL
jgi:hypothetical protein